MKLILVRHGQTEQNKNKVWQGHSEGMLDQEGKEQAKRLAEKLEEENINMVYCSDLQRAKDTLKPFLEKKDLPVHYVKELRERNLGVLEGATTEQIEKYMLEKNMDFDNANFETGEYQYEFQKRIFRIYNEVVDKHENDTVLFVTHGGTVAQFMLSLFNHPPEKFREFVPKNTGITRLIVEKGKPKLLEFNDISHLDVF